MNVDELKRFILNQDFTSLRNLGLIYMALVIINDFVFGPLVRWLILNPLVPALINIGFRINIVFFLYGLVMHLLLFSFGGCLLLMGHKLYKQGKNFKAHIFFGVLVITYPLFLYRVIIYLLYLTHILTTSFMIDVTPFITIDFWFYQGHFIIAVCMMCKNIIRKT